MKRTTAIGVLTAIVGFLVSPTYAQHNHGGGGMPMPSPTAARTGTVKGTFVSRDETSIQVKVKDKEHATTLMIDRGTKFKGELEPGAEVTVKYRDDGGVQKASSVEAKKAKAKH